MSAADSPQRVVLLVHGMNTEGIWEDMVKEVLQDAETVVIPLGYEYFDPFRFWYPFLFRRKPIEWITREIQDVRVLYPDAKLSAIAHSFGTYIIGNLLDDNPAVRLHGLILCGSVLPRKFRWDKLGGRVGRIVNDCGVLDRWPVWATCLSWGYGASGTWGFRSPRVADRFHKVDHGGFFTPEFVREFWEPFLKLEEVTPSRLERTLDPWWLSVLPLLPLNAVVFVAFWAVLLLAGWGVYRTIPHVAHVGQEPAAPTQGEPEPPVSKPSAPGRILSDDSAIRGGLFALVYFILQYPKIRNRSVKIKIRNAVFQSGGGALAAALLAARDGLFPWWTSYPIGLGVSIYLSQQFERPPALGMVPNGDSAADETS